MSHRSARTAHDPAGDTATPGAAGLRDDLPSETAGTAHAPREASFRTFNLTVERAAYLTIALLAIVTRFWDLSSRAMNHDESLHTYFSWRYLDDFHYIHDPLMHGPALFHLNALAYFLFGDNDYTSRILTAFVGTLIVLMPALLRSPNLLGRWGALSASIFLLFSPSILYYSRFIRHDILALFPTFLIAIAALRYLERPERRWLVAAGAATGFLFCTKEVSFIVAFIFVTFIGLIVAWQVRRAMFAVLIGAGVLLGATVLGLRALGVEPLPSIPWEDPTNRNISQFAFDLARHPLVLASLGVIGLAVIAAMMVADRLRTPDGGWLDDVLGRTEHHTTAFTLYRALSDRRGMLLATGLGLSIFIVLYTSLFTNFAGLASATFGALGYWLGQQDVQRGAQPWFYYLLLLPQYEFVAVVLFPFAGALTLWRTLPRIRRSEPVGRRQYMRGFLLYWSVLMLAVLSWAGEKMPWLSVHIALPMILLAASYTGEALELAESRLRADSLSKRTAIALWVGIPLVVASWFLVWAWGSAGPWVWNDDVSNYVRTLRPAVSDNPWILYIPAVALLGLVAYAIRRLGPKAGLATAAIAFVGAMVLGQLHVAYRFTYEEGDVAVDMLMYSQASPDVVRVMDEIGALSREMTGRKDIRIWYDSGVLWPFSWYLRDYPNRRYYGTSLDTPPDAEIVLVSEEGWAESQDMLTGYTYQEYTMRWFFPENPTYRRFAIAPELNDEGRQNYQTDEPGPYTAGDVIRSVINSLWSMREPQQQAKMFRLVAYRELWDQIRSDFNFRIYVRNDLVEQWNEVRY